MPKRSAILLFALALAFSGRSQLQTQGGITPANLVQNFLLGQGVTASNITYQGASQAIGYFDASNANVGLGSGIIMTTGTISPGSSQGIPAGPHGPNNHGGAGIDNNQPGDPNLAAIAGNQSFNASILEFDFVPNSDTISFNYVFGSEEYIEYVGQSVNDVFAFFVSGPNPSGGNYNNTNIALIPGTNTSVNINTLNHQSNSQYYINNGTGINNPYASNPYYVQYDGLTTVLKAEAAVVCGQTYHIKIAISDIGDGILDSGVFLEEGSFRSMNPIEISHQLSFNAFSSDSTLAEGCGAALITVERFDSINYAQTFSVSTSGSATANADYTGVPNSITFPAGQSTTTFLVNATHDGVVEGIEDFNIEVVMNGLCGGNHVESYKLYINDVADLEVTLDDTSIVCQGTPVTLSPTVAGGLPGYTYQWSTGASTPTIQVLPGSTQTYSVTITDTCGRQETDQCVVTVPNFQPLVVDAGMDQTVSCPNTPVNLTATVSGGGGNYQYQWSDNLGTSQNVTAVPYVTSTYVVTVTDDCGVLEQDSVTVTVTTLPLTVSITPDSEICPGDSIDLVAVPSGGAGPDYDFLWSTGETDSVITVAPNKTTTYTVGVMDACGTYQIEDSVVISIYPITANFSVLNRNNEVHIPIEFENESSGAVSYSWDFGNGQTSNDIDPVVTYDSVGFYTVTLIAYSAYGCSDTISKVILVRPEFNFYAPNAFTPNGDGKNDVFAGKGTAVMSYRMRIFDRWGQLIFETNEVYEGWDGTVSGQPAKVDTYVYKFDLQGYDEQFYHFTGHVTLLR